VETSGTEQQQKAAGLMPAQAVERTASAASPAWAAHLHWLFLVSVAIRGALALVLFLCAVYVLDLLYVSDAVGWGVLGLATAGVAWVFLDEAYDIEGAFARAAAAAAAFDPDPYGARAEAVRAYSDEFVRTHGDVPRGRARLRQPGSDRLFRAYFLSRGARYRRWCIQVLLGSAQRGLRVVAAGLLAIIAAQAYTLLAG
jgi:hypothetical protein